ncbi:hypothetical protein M422DRAFT_239468 [Sphaerobolus stellatus SS14]|nr:hypothetical protein M422DRAFT_239468 [Sphaerobolus stellatus SS14]
MSIIATRLFHVPTILNPRAGLLSHLCSVFALTALAGTFSTFTSSLTSKSFPRYLVNDDDTRKAIADRKWATR